jgi:hypothetical protein
MTLNNPGEEKAWELLAALDPDAVSRTGSASYDDSAGLYRIRSFGMDFEVSAAARTISSAAPGSDILLQRLGYFFRLSVLWYLVHAKDLACTGRLVKLQGIKGGDIFTTGSHVLPLDQVANKYGRNGDPFLEKGISLGGTIEKVGDAAVRLFPLPRIPVVLALWLEDDEFPARADLLFDSTCELQLPTDVIWSVAMMTVLSVL